MTRSPESTPPIELDHLSVRLGERTILSDLDSRLEGRSIGLLGPNGAGKSTLMQTLLGFHPPSEGTARIFGLDVRSDTREIRHHLGYMPENDAFVTGMSAIRLVRMMGELSGLPPHVALERAHETLFFLGLGEARYRKVETYSLGMKQLTKLAVATVHGPRMLILDEPTNGLDASGRARMIEIIRTIRDSGHTRILLSSHLLRDVEECCDEVVILKDGRLVQYANLEAERRTNRKFLNLEIQGVSDAFLESARESGCELAVNGSRRIKMVLPENVEVRDLYRIASVTGVEIQRLSAKRDSLEEIFMKAMERPQAADPVTGARPAGDRPGNPGDIENPVNEGSDGGL
jgi:ABC-2 type transport system ATP-binding protein